MRIAALILGILGGLAGAALPLAKPKAAGTMMIISAAAGVCFIYYGYLIAAVLLLMGGIFALIGQRDCVKKAKTARSTLIGFLDPLQPGETETDLQAAGAVFSGDQTVVFFHDGSGDGQAQAGAAALGDP